MYDLSDNNDNKVRKAEYKLQYRTNPALRHASKRASCFFPTPTGTVLLPLRSIGNLFIQSCPWSISDKGHKQCMSNNIHLVT